MQTMNDYGSPSASLLTGKQSTSSFTALGTIKAIAIWLLLVLVSMAAFLMYEGKPSYNAAALPMAPISEDVAEPKRMAKIFIALHPKCPCSRVTLDELLRIVDQCSQPAQFIILVYVPNLEPVSWIESSSTDLARSLPNSVVYIDRNGQDAANIGIHTSGGMVAYDADGNLCFSGGILQSRGFAGDNIGSRTLTQLLYGKPTEHVVTTPVFGCSLITPAKSGIAREGGK
jgi:hypothetical protein